MSQKKVEQQMTQRKVVQQIISAHSPDDNFDVDKTALLTMAQDILCNEFATLVRVHSKLPSMIYLFSFVLSL